MKTFRLFLLGFLPISALIALPLLLRLSNLQPNIMSPDRSSQYHENLVIITPHNECIRFEFEMAFKRYMLKKENIVVSIDWRMPGGTSDIVKYINDRFTTEFKTYWESIGNKWDKKVAESFSNNKLDKTSDNIDPILKLARKQFLESNVGIGIDLFFGGGQYEMEKQAQKGFAVNAGLLEMHPDWFYENVIPQKFSGEIFYDPEGRYYGTCISSFGIFYNQDCIDLLGIKAPERWKDLSSEKYFNFLTLADPTKSGSINKCFEMIVQQTIANAIKNSGRKTIDSIELGWKEGLNLIKKIGANSRYITDSASKVPADVARGDSAAGICIDFYGRTQAEWAHHQIGNRARLKYVTPIGGSSISADTIMLFRGAPNKKIAVKFIEFVLSTEGQNLWNAMPGTPGGPEKYALRRLPIRKDMYSEDKRAFMSDPDANPFSPEEEFYYDPSLTARYFPLLRILFKVMVMDPLPELKNAWKKIIENGGPEKNPQAMKEFEALPFKYAEADKVNSYLNPSSEGNTPLKAIEKQRELSEFFRKQYLKTAQILEELKMK
ncbi:MAG TPA: ABC transporter substrate-binding protein [Victivallales bacterium]|nr:ABC transporter substrate-binding protein [Victivallales bacterium]HPO89557.1 ABC transporter substrate-binding protein [Victivallales bacterium]HRR28629.1 ABC transporter substrate-binding protein [Victivallales bacterium]HRU00388.1 ABC transporter substrate-binding protein [Victivallales bacterium]